MRDLPRNPACLASTAISIIRCQGTFRFVPEASRHYAARPQEALDTEHQPPIPVDATVTIWAVAATARKRN